MPGTYAADHSHRIDFIRILGDGLSQRPDLDILSQNTVHLMAVHTSQGGGSQALRRLFDEHRLSHVNSAITNRTCPIASAAAAAAVAEQNSAALRYGTNHRRGERIHP
eukprot:2633858-Pyramimonas_sp.AAC.2